MSQSALWLHICGYVNDVMHHVVCRSISWQVTDIAGLVKGAAEGQACIVVVYRYDNRVLVMHSYLILEQLMAFYTWFAFSRMRMSSTLKVVIHVISVDSFHCFQCHIHRRD